MSDLKTSCLYYDKALKLYNSIGVDADTLHHCNRVARIYGDCLRDTEILGFLNKENQNVRVGVYILGAFLHDIGKACVPLEYLNKKGKLTPEEFNVIKQHAELGKFIAPILSGNFELNMYEYSVVCKMIQLHHENYDGSGYPYGLKGVLTPLYVKLLSIFDVYDALTSKRSYKEAMSSKEAISIIIEDSGKKFDTDILYFVLNKAENKGYD